MRRRVSALLCALLLLLTACGGAGRSGESEGYQVYFTDPFDPGDPNDRLEGPALVSETRRIPAGADVLGGLMECLLSGPISDELSSPFPEGVYQLEPPTLVDGICRVNLSEKYGGLSEVALTLADYAITLTLCQTPGVEGVSIDVEGQPISYRDLPLLRESDVILSSAEDEPVYLSAELYYLRRSGALGVEQREILVSGTDTPASALLSALLEGPADPELSLPMPEGTEVLSVWVDGDGTCFVDLSAPFRDGAPASGYRAKLLLYAIVNTLCQLPGVDVVQLRVEGAALERYGGVPTASPLEAAGELVTDG